MIHLVSLFLVAAALTLAAQAQAACQTLCDPRFMPAATTDDIRRQLENGADPNAKDGRGATPLHWAARLNPDPAIAELLLANGARVDAREALFGATPLHWAAYHNANPAIAKLLLNHGANLAKGDRDDRTPFHWATVKANLTPRP